MSRYRVTATLQLPVFDSDIFNCIEPCAKVRLTSTFQLPVFESDTFRWIEACTKATRGTDPPPPSLSLVTGDRLRNRLKGGGGREERGRGGTIFMEIHQVDGCDFLGGQISSSLFHFPSCTPPHPHIHRRKLQALVYDILPSTTAVFGYAIGSKKLSASEQCFVGAQTVVCYKQLK